MCEKRRRFISTVIYIVKGILVLAIFGFSFRCDDPLGSLLDDTSMRASVDKLLVYEGELASIGFRLNANLFSDGKSATLTANLRCKGLSKSAQASRVTIDKNTITWTNSDWAAWKTFVFDSPDNQTQEPSTNCELVLDPLESNDAGFHGFNKIKPIPVIVLDNDGDANIKVSSRGLVLPEGGSVSYTIRLTNPPRNQVEVNILHKNDFPEWFLVSSKPTITVGGASVTVGGASVNSSSNPLKLDSLFLILLDISPHIFEVSPILKLNVASSYYKDG